MAKDSPTVEMLIRHTSEAIRRAFEEGYRQGELAAVDKMMVAVGGQTPPTFPTTSFKTAVSILKDAPPIGGEGKSYGKVINHIRAAIAESNHVGVGREAILAYCDQQKVDVSPNQYRDTMKRLTGGDEIVRRHGVYFVGPRFRGDILDNARRTFGDVEHVFEGEMRSPEATTEQPAEDA